MDKLSSQAVATLFAEALRGAGVEPQALTVEVVAGFHTVEWGPEGGRRSVGFPIEAADDATRRAIATAARWHAAMTARARARTEAMADRAVQAQPVGRKPPSA